MIERDAFMTYLVLLGFEALPSSKYSKFSDDFGYRIQFKSLRPVILLITVYQNKTHITYKPFGNLVERVRSVTSEYGAEVAFNGHHGGALRWIKDNFERVIEEAEEHGGTKIQNA